MLPAEDGEKLISRLPFSSLIFARQWFVVGELLQHLPPEDNYADCRHVAGVERAAARFGNGAH